MLRASDFLINTVLQIENYLKNNSLLHSPMSAADRVQKVPFAGKWRQLHGEAMSGFMQSTLLERKGAED